MEWKRIVGEQLLLNELVKELLVLPVAHGERWLTGVLRDFARSYRWAGSRRFRSSTLAGTTRCWVDAGRIRGGPLGRITTLLSLRVDLPKEARLSPCAHSFLGVPVFIAHCRLGGQPKRSTLDEYPNVS